MDQLKAAFQFIKNAVNGETEPEKILKSEESFSPYDLLRDFDIRSFVEEKYLIHARDPNARDALLWGLKEIRSMSDEKLFDFVVDNYFESEEDLYEFAIAYAQKINKKFPAWWKNMVKPKTEEN